jgi:hypothetical protein
MFDFILNEGHNFNCFHHWLTTANLPHRVQNDANPITDSEKPTFFLMIIISLFSGLPLLCPGQTLHTLSLHSSYQCPSVTDLRSELIGKAASNS